MTARLAPANWRTRLSPHGTLVALVLLLTIPPLTAIGILGWRVLNDARTMDATAMTRRDTDARRIAAGLKRALNGWNTIAATAPDHAPQLPPNVAIVFFDRRGISRADGIRLPYLPAVSALPVRLDPAFSDAERLEFGGDATRALSAYRALTQNPEPATRAVALMRLARVVRKTQPREALAIYSELMAMGDIRVEGDPAELIARHERIALLGTTGSQQAAQREAGLLAQLLADGRFLIDRTTFDLYSTGLPVGSQDESRPERALADALLDWWPYLQRSFDQPSGVDASGPFVIVWAQRADATAAALVGSIDQLVAGTGDDLRSMPFSLQARTGAFVWGSVPPADTARVTVDPSLPWTLHVGVSDTQDARRALTSSTNLLIGTSAVVLFAIVAASYLAFRAVRHELEVARLQSEFVAAVSHEFRTPLAALCHLSELLEEGATVPERLPKYYQALSRESRRLHTMVESLLDFGRIEAGRRIYEPAPTDISAIIRDVAQQCRDQIPSASGRLELVGIDAAHQQVTVDRAALALALRNLIENALKYSSEDSPVTISTAVNGVYMDVSVQDRGPGIPATERRQVFRKFVRGSAARALNVKGTGIGLAIANQIVQAHGGRLDLDSAIGQGSCFTVRLPRPIGDE
jgi:signal transduction histidine kinase